MLRHATQRLFGAASAPARSQFKPVVTRPQNKLSAPNVVRVPHAGVSVLQDPTSNKGTGFSTAERDRLRIRGLVPPAYTDLAVLSLLLSLSWLCLQKLVCACAGPDGACDATVPAAARRSEPLLVPDQPSGPQRSLVLQSARHTFA
eukprot:TRINITY_DN5096_c0_g1_i2.p2 TRINITY_DN5096_c0_g1~~TRINITY_DN5096_c0_g1_i2.p2  ORF type:complete len:153 (-),score=26.07 TRINITY_DN5096_c0_g1_i2:309-746(-)